MEALLGKPEDVRHDPDSDSDPTEETWCYGSEGHLSLPTLGQVYFQKGHVIGVKGGDGTPPSPSVIAEEELRTGMRFLHTGPEGTTYSDPLRLIRVTNYLQPLGKAKALAIIGEYARVGSVKSSENWLFLLLRTLFDVPNPPGWMPEMYIGMMFPSPPKDRTRVPRFPIVIVDDIPFSLLQGVDLAGEAEPVSDHVTYFRQQGVLRATRLSPSNDPFLSFQTLLASKEGKTLGNTAQAARALTTYGGNPLRQVLRLVRTVYSPPKNHQHFNYLEPNYYEECHQAFLRTGARWDEALQMYVRKDGSYGTAGHSPRR